MSDKDRRDLSIAFKFMIEAAADLDLNRLVGAIAKLKADEPRTYQALRGNTLLIDILNEVDEEYAYRNPPPATGETA